MKNLLKTIFQKQVLPKNYDRREKLKRIIGFAQSAAKDDPRLVFDVINAFASYLQYDRIINPIWNETQGASEQRDYNNLFKGLSVDVQSHVTELDGDWEIDLGREPLLVWPWSASQLKQCLAAIGRGHFRGPWKQDPENHKISLIAPLGIAKVGGGNHSISTGILRREGKIRGNRILDISPLIKKYRTDGENIYELATEEKIGETGDFLWAILFELGRLVIANNEFRPAMHPIAHSNHPLQEPRLQTEEDWKDWLLIDPVSAQSWFLQYVTERISKIEKYEFTAIFSILGRLLAEFGGISISMVNNGSCGIRLTTENTQGDGKLADCSPIYTTFADSLAAIVLIQIGKISPSPLMSNGLPIK